MNNKIILLLVSSPTVSIRLAVLAAAVFVRSTAILEPFVIFLFSPEESARQVRGWKWRDHDLAQTSTPFLVEAQPTM